MADEEVVKYLHGVGDGCAFFLWVRGGIERGEGEMSQVRGRFHDSGGHRRTGADEINKEFSSVSRKNLNFP